MNVLVTGGAGFIGSHLVDALVDKGHRVRILDSLVQQVHGNSLPAHLNKSAEFIRGDVCDAEIGRQISPGYRRRLSSGGRGRHRTVDVRDRPLCKRQ